MAKSTAERVGEWRRRMVLRAQYFEHLNEDRVLRLGFDPADTRPEYLAIRRCMEAYPRAKTAPVSVDFSAAEGGWFIEFDYDASSESDWAACALAMAEITSAPVCIHAAGDGKGFMFTGLDVPGIAAVRAEIEDLRSSGMLRSQ